MKRRCSVRPVFPLYLVKEPAARKKYQWKFCDLVSPVSPPQRYGISNGLGASLYRCVAWLKPPSGSERELHGGGGSIFDQDHQLFCGDDVTNPHRMPDDRQAVIDVQNAIKKRGC